MTAKIGSIRSVIPAFIALSLLQTDAAATDIPGVQPYAYDQPQVNFALVESGDTPLTDGLWGDFNLKGLLDTGASGVVIDPYYTDSFLGLGLSIYEWGGQPGRVQRCSGRRQRRLQPVRQPGASNRALRAAGQYQQFRRVHHCVRSERRPGACRSGPSER